MVRWREPENVKVLDLTLFHMAGKEGQFDVVELMVIKSINLNALHGNGMTLYD